MFDNLLNTDYWVEIANCSEVPLERYWNCVKLVKYKYGYR